MSATVILTDDQVLSIIAQLGNRVRPKPENDDSTEHNEHGAALIKVKDYLSRLMPGEPINVRGLGKELKVQHTAISVVLANLKDKGQVEMVMRGTWRKL